MGGIGRDESRDCLLTRVCCRMGSHGHTLLDASMSEHLDQFQELQHPWEMLEEWLKEDTCVFDAKVRLTGPTVLDARMSYCIYKAADITTPYIVHNLYELIAFMAHPRHQLGVIIINTRQHPRPSGFKMIPLPWEEVKIAMVQAKRAPRPLHIYLDGQTYHTGTEGRPWW